MPADVSVSWVINALLSNATVTAKVGARVYKRHISLVPNPTYPCVTIQRQAGGYAHQGAPLDSSQVLITAHSRFDYDQAWEILRAIETVLGHATGNDSDRWWCLRRSSAPLETADDTAEVIFQVHAAYWLYEVR